MTLQISGINRTTNVRGNLHGVQVGGEQSVTTSRINSHKIETTSDLNPVLATLLPHPSIGRFTGTLIPRDFDETKPTTNSVDGNKQEQNTNHRIKFTPYTHQTPGKSLVHIRGKGDAEDSRITLVYEPNKIPDPSKTPRNEIKLKGISPKLLRQARLVAKEVLNEWKVAHDLKAEYKTVRKAFNEALKDSFKYRKIIRDPLDPSKKEIKRRYRSTEEKTSLREQLALIKQRCEEHPFVNLHGRSTTVSFESFQRVFYMKAPSLASKGSIDESLIDNVQFQTLVAYLCLRKNKKKGVLNLPHGILNYDDENLVKKLETLGRYVLVNKLGLDTAEKIEKFKNCTEALGKCGLHQLSRLISTVDLLKLLFVGYLDGPNPPIREWLIPAPNKWQSQDPGEFAQIKTNAERACKYVISDQGVVNPDGTIDIEKFLEKDWSKIFYEPQYGLRGAIGICPLICGTVDALNVAVPGIIGNGRPSLPRAKFKYPNKWNEEGKLEVIDELTRYLVERKLKLFDGNGKVSAKKIKEIGAWHKQYDEECTGCLHRSGIGNASEALRRVYPNLFGWKMDQISPGDIRFIHMWEGEEGERLFQLKFAKSIYTVFEELKEKGVEGFKNHKVRFYPDLDHPLHITRQDLSNLKNYYMSHGIQWYDHFQFFNLTGGFAEVGLTLENAFLILLGEPSTKTKCFGDTDIPVSDVVDRMPARTQLIINLLKDLDIDNGDVSLITLNTARYANNSTGIEGTCLESLLAHRPPSDLLDKTQALYEALAAAVLPSPTGDKDSREKDRQSALEKILIATYPTGAKKGELILSDRRLSHLLKTISEVILNEVNIDDKTKAQLKKSINQIRRIKKPSGNPREVLLAACNIDKKYGERANPLGLLNSILEHVFELVTLHEIRHQKLNGNFSEHFNNILGHIEIVENTRKSKEKGDEENGELTEELSEEVEQTSTPDPFDDTDYKEVKETEELVSQTRRIIEGHEEENPVVIKTLVQIANDKTQSRKYRIGFLQSVLDGDLTAQIRMLNQLQERLKLRSLDRYDYSSLRAKPLPVTRVDTIVDNETGCITNLDYIDKELFTCIPDWWPRVNNEPAVIPLLYWNNVLYLAVRANYNPNLNGLFTQKLNDCQIEFKPIRVDSWLNLVQYFRQNFRYRITNEERKPLKQFISEEEENLLIENVAFLRKGAVELLQEISKVRGERTHLVEI